MPKTAGAKKTFRAMPSGTQTGALGAAVAERGGEHGGRGCAVDGRQLHVSRETSFSFCEKGPLKLRIPLFLRNLWGLLSSLVLFWPGTGLATYKGILLAWSRRLRWGGKGHHV
jgi:hypothetical protein